MGKRVFFTSAGILAALAVFLVVVPAASAGECYGRARYVAPAYVYPTYSYKQATTYYTPTYYKTYEYLPLAVYQPFSLVGSVGSSFDPDATLKQLLVNELIEGNRELRRERQRLFQGKPEAEEKPQGKIPRLDEEQPRPKGRPVATALKPQAQAVQQAALQVFSTRCAECHTGATAKGPKDSKPFVIFETEGKLSPDFNKARAFTYAYRGKCPPGKPLSDPEMEKLFDFLEVD